jgi:PKD repeat protein
VHTGGGLRFAPDGKLFLSIGESGVREQAQNPDSLSGKIVRLNPDGTAPTDNPGYTGDPTAVRSKVWANGLRNPFRIGIQPGTGLPFIADVGGIYIEEVNKGIAGANYGWPCYEAQLNLNYGPVCDPLYQSGTQTLPIYQYSHPPGAAVIGGVFYQGVNYPAEYEDAFFFGDYVRNFVHSINVDANNDMVPGSLRTVLPSAATPVSFQNGPEGNVYFASIGNGAIYRIRYATDNRPPVAVAEASPTNGPAPLSVQFTGDGSYDPDLDPLTYLWDFGDGDTSTAPNPTHVYENEGPYVATLTVTDDSDVSAEDTVSISAGNLLPIVTISAPPDGMIYQPGETVAFSGSANDAEDGSIPESGLMWDIRLQHCEVQGGSCHDHPYWQDPGSSGSFQTADATHATFGVDFVFHELTLIATDSDLDTGTATVVISPDSDGDGLSDQMEFFLFGLDPFDTDSDDDGTPDGDEDFDSDRCGNLAEMQTAPGSEQTGGLRDPFNPWDYFNSGKDGVNRVTDISLVIQHYGHDQGVAPDYSSNFDRTPLAGGYAWEFGPPNGTIRIVDVSGAVSSYGHDCST